MGVLNEDLIRLLAERFGVETFIETGTAQGVSSSKAVQVFPVVHTVELSSEFYQFASHHLDARIHCHRGRSTDFLTKWLTRFGEVPIVYWLDAHYSGDPSAGKDRQCPLLEELDIINGRLGSSDFIIIDDAHVFFSPFVMRPPFDTSHWPSLQQIFGRLDRKDRYTVVLMSYKILNSVDIVTPDDAIISVPRQTESEFRKILQILTLQGSLTT